LITDKTGEISNDNIITLQPPTRFYGAIFKHSQLHCSGFPLAQQMSW